jgi:plasmid stabilization system protein ParE
MKIRILDAAERDLEEGYRFYDSQDPGLGSYFLDSLFSDIDSLAYFGGMHRFVKGYHRLLAKRFPFAVYYRVIVKCQDIGYPILMVPCIKTSVTQVL